MVFSDEVMSEFRAQIKNKLRITKFNDDISESSLTKHGVPQEPVLRPLLLLYILMMINLIRNS